MTQSIALERAHRATPIPAHLAIPRDGKGPWPGVVVLHDVFGYTRDLHEISDRFAEAGYLTVAPNLFVDGAVRCIKGMFLAMLTGRGATFDDIDTVRRWLVARGDCTGRVGVVGFCMGGGFALLSAPRGFQASAPNYPYAPGNLDRLLEGACPVVASFGGLDPLPHVTSAAPRLRRALDLAGVPHDIHEYPEARHAFINRHGFGRLTELARICGLEHHGPAAEHAWDRMLRFFERHLGGAPPD